MQTTDQVVGEAREMIAGLIKQHVYCDATGLSPHIASVFLGGFDAAADAILAALRAQPERGAEEMRPAIHAWIREDVPLAGKMNLFPEHVDALIAKLRALPLHPAKDDGGGR